MNIEEVHKGSKLLIDGTPYNVDIADFVKPGKGRAIYRLKLRNLLDSSSLDRTYHSGEKADEVSISTQECQYLYKEDDRYIFMNSDTFEQFFIPESLLGSKVSFLKEGTVVTVMMMGDRPLDVNIPNFVELKVLESAVATRSDTVTAQMKDAVLETGHTIGVPVFIKEGDIIKIDTRTGSYVERVNVKK